MEIINIPDVSLSEVELPAWFSQKSTDEQANAIQAGMITDEKLLHKLAKTHADEEIACTAVEKLVSVKDDYSILALADIALHGKIIFARALAAGSIPRRGFIHTHFIQAGSLPCQGLIYAVSVQADEDLVRQFAAKELLSGTAAAYETPLRKSIFTPQLFDLLYLLDPEEDMDYIEFLARSLNGGARGKIVARLLPPERVPKPEDEEPENDVAYWLTRNLMYRENDIEALTNAVFDINSDLISSMSLSCMTGRRYYDPCDSYSQLVSRMAFSRLTGWRHDEPCDSYSHRTYECGRVAGLTAEQIITLCQRTVHEKDQVLVEAANAILKKMAENDCEQ